MKVNIFNIFHKNLKIVYKNKPNSKLLKAPIQSADTIFYSYTL
jgi:hypothetical protein